MAVTDAHGGGLTIKRILQEDVKLFDKFFFPSEFALLHPPDSVIIGKSDFTLMPSDAAWTKKALYQKLIHRFRLGTFSKKFYAKWYVSKIGRTVRLKDSKWLICPQSERSLWITAELKRRYNIQYLFWVMDDHLIRWKSGNLVYDNAEIKNLMGFCLQSSVHNWVISPAMQQLYKEQFSVESEVLFGPSLSISEKVEQKDRLSNKFVYFGAVTEWQLDALIFLSLTLPLINGELHIYSAKDSLPESLSQLPNVFYQGKINPTDIPSIASKYKSVVLPISFEDSMAHLSELNIATKMSECLSLGIVAVVIGKPQAAMVQYLSGKECCIIIDKYDTQEAVQKLSLLDNKQLCSVYLANAYKLVTSELSQKVMYNKWKSGLMKLSNKTETYPQ
jgi:hypothetical protein